MKLCEGLLRATVAFFLLLSLGACQWLHEVTAPTTPVAKESPVKPVRVRAIETQIQGHCTNSSALTLIEEQEFDAAYQRLDAELKKTPPSKQSVDDRYCSQLTRSLLLLLPGSPYQDLERAQAVIEQLQEDGELADFWAASAFDRIAIGKLVSLQELSRELEEENERLRADLQVKSEALLKLKQLTIGGQ